MVYLVHKNQHLHPGVMKPVSVENVADNKLKAVFIMQGITVEYTFRGETLSLVGIKVDSGHYANKYSDVEAFSSLSGALTYWGMISGFVLQTA